MVPLIDPRLLNDNMAEEAVNCDLSSGQLHGLFAPVEVHDFSATPGPVEKGYLFVVDDEQLWVPLPSKYTSVVRSPLANDDQHRLYWTSPGQLTPQWSTFARIKAGNPPYSLGTIQPTTALVITGATGGTTTVPKISRAYVYTWLNSIGEESSPSPPSNVFDWYPDGTWTVAGFPTSAPANPSAATIRRLPAWYFIARSPARTPARSITK